VEDHLAVVHQVDPVGDRERLPHRVVGDEDPDAAAGPELLDQALDLADAFRVHPGEGLVEEDEVGVGGQRPGDLQPAALAAREGVGVLVLKLGEPELVEELERDLEPLLLGKRAVLEDREQVFERGHPPEGRGLLREVAEPHPRPLVHGKPAHVLPPELDPPGVRPDEAHHHVEGGGLSRPVGAEEGDDLAPAELEVHPPHHLAPAVALL